MVKKIKAGFEPWDRPIDELYYFTGDDGKPMLFDSKEAAEKYLRDHGYTDLDMKFIAFQDEDGRYVD